MIDYHTVQQQQRYRSALLTNDRSNTDHLNLNGDYDYNCDANVEVYVTTYGDKHHDHKSDEVHKNFSSLQLEFPKDQPGVAFHRSDKNRRQRFSIIF